MKNFIQPGRIVPVPAPAAVNSGQIVIVGALAGVAVHDAGSGEPVELCLEGVYDLPKASAQAWATLGLPIYWNGTVCTTEPADATFIGVNVETAANPSGVGRVRLNAALGIPSGAQITAEIAVATA